MSQCNIFICQKGKEETIDLRFKHQFNIIPILQGQRESQRGERETYRLKDLSINSIRPRYCKDGGKSEREGMLPDKAQVFHLSL